MKKDINPKLSKYFKRIEHDSGLKLHAGKRLEEHATSQRDNPGGIYLTMDKRKQIAKDPLSAKNYQRYSKDFYQRTGEIDLANSSNIMKDIV